MKKKFLIPSLSFFFIVVIIRYLSFLHYFAKNCNGWVIGDWLVNFQAGFVRRGLSGYLIIGLSDFLKLEPNFTTMWIQLLIYVAYMFILFFLIYRKEMETWFLILLLSPITLLFPILNFNIGIIGRKEIILFFLFALYILCLNRKLLKSPIVIFLFSVAFLLATLFHELVFFYTPYFILAAYLRSKIDHEPFDFSKILYMILGSFLIMIAIYLFGKTINGSIICAGLMEKGLSSNICKGILSFPKDYGIKDVLRVAKENRYFPIYGAYFLLGLVPIILFVRYSKSCIVSIKKFLVAFLFLFLFSIPLFVLGVDWGRWINIHFMLLLFTSTLLLKDISSGSKVIWLKENFAIPTLWKSETNISKISNGIAFFLICFLCITIFVYAILWWYKFSIFFTILFILKIPY